MSNGKLTLLRIFAIIFGAPLFIPVSCTVSAIPFLNMHVENDARDISSGDKPHRAFQVVLHNNVENKLVGYRLESLDKLNNEDGRYSYRLPGLQGEFKEGQWNKYSYTVIEQTPDKQTIEVYFSDDDINGTSRYRVEGTTIIPIYSKFFLPGHGISSLPYAFTVSMIIYFFGRHLRKVYRRKKAQSKAENYG